MATTERVIPFNKKRYVASIVDLPVLGVYTDPHHYLCDYFKAGKERIPSEEILEDAQYLVAKAHERKMSRKSLTGSNYKKSLVKTPVQALAHLKRMERTISNDMGQFIGPTEMRFCRFSMNHGLMIHRSDRYGICFRLDHVDFKNRGIFEISIYKEHDYYAVMVRTDSSLIRRVFIRNGSLSNEFVGFIDSKEYKDCIKAQKYVMKLGSKV